MKKSKNVYFWRRPLSSVYQQNYRFGESLYESQVSRIESKYRDSMAQLQRNLTNDQFQTLRLFDYEPEFQTLPLYLTQLSMFDPPSNRRRQANESFFTIGVNRFLDRVRNDFHGYAARRKSNYVDSFTVYRSAKDLVDIDLGLEHCKARRIMRRPDTAYWVDYSD